MTERLVYTVNEAAEAANVHPTTIYRAIRTTGVDRNGRPTFPPPLRVKRKGSYDKAAYMILRVDLEDWLERWPDG